MTLSRKSRRAPGENPVLRRHFVHELAAHDQAGDLAAFVDDLSDEHFEGTANPFWLIGVEFYHLVDSRTLHKLTPTGRDFFRSWLRHHGIDPDTGNATLQGYDFLRRCLDDRPAV